MRRITYNKLIADKVPENMEKQGVQFEVRTLTDDAEYERELLKKVVEEAKELESAPSKEHALKEIADVLEVIDAVKKLKGISDDEVVTMKATRLEKRGGFLKRIFLLWSEDDGYEAKKTS